VDLVQDGVHQTATSPGGVRPAKGALIHNA